jgi:ribonuclease P protein component
MSACACSQEKAGASLCALRYRLFARLLPVTAANETYSHTCGRRDSSSRARTGPMFLRVSRDIEQVKRHGRRSSTQCFNLLASRTEDSVSQVGIVVGRRFGNAVKRNRSKRRFRELVRAIYPNLIPGYHLLVFPKRDALTLSFSELKALWTATLSKHRLLNTESI